MNELQWSLHTLISTLPPNGKTTFNSGEMHFKVENYPASEGTRYVVTLILRQSQNEVQQELLMGSLKQVQDQIQSDQFPALLETRREKLSEHLR